MRKLNTGSDKYTKVLVEDEPSYGNACHKFYISPSEKPENVIEGEFGHIFFQKGPVKEKGINGCQNEDLLAIVIDRLQSFQAGYFACRENELALTKVQEAMHWLNHRTNERIKRGVEGTNAQ